MLSNKQNLGLVLGVLGVSLFAGSLPATRIAVAEIDPYFLTALRSVIAGAAGLMLLIALRRPLPPKPAYFPLAMASLTILLGFPLLASIAMVTVPSSHGGVILGIMPLATAAAAAVIEKERPSRGFWIAATIGSALVIAFALYRGGGHTLSLGDILLIVAVACAGIGYTYSARLAAIMPGWEVISWVVALSLPVSLTALALTWPADITAISMRAWIAVLYVGLLAQLVGFFLWNAAMALGGISRVGQISLLQPFIVVLLAAAVVGEALDLQTLFFAAAVVITVAIGTRMRVGSAA